MARETFPQGLKGTADFFDAERGYGFIDADDGSVRAFVHILALQRCNIETLQRGQRVSFGLKMGRYNRACATNLKLLDEPIRKLPEPAKRAVAVTTLKRRRTE